MEDLLLEKTQASNSSPCSATKALSARARSVTSSSPVPQAPSARLPQHHRIAPLLRKGQGEDEVAARVRSAPRVATSCSPRREVGPLLTPTFSILEVEKGAAFTPTKTPTFGYFGARAGKRGAHPDQPTEGKRGAGIFHPFPGENGKNFSLQLIFQQIAWVGVSAPVENRALRAIFAIFLRFARFWADFWRSKPPLLTPTFASSEVIYHHLLTPTSAC